jgi:PPOX class probable F420-dependent enzyme
MTPTGLSTAEGLAQVAKLAAPESWLAVLVTQRRDGEPAVSLINAGIVPHPVTGEQVLALVSRGRTTKLANLRRTPRATLVFRRGWEWIGVSGTVELAGPDDPLPGLPADRIPQLLRDIYHAAGGEHPDLAEYDREMVADRRTAVLVTPTKFTVNPRPTEHPNED